MTTSTNAILFYGYCWEEEDVSCPWKIGEEDDEEEDEDDEDWEKRYAFRKGCIPPSAKFPEKEGSKPKYSAAEKKIVDQYAAYWDKKQQLVEEATCEVATHCSGECPMPYVAVKASSTIAHRGTMKEITSLKADPTWDKALTEFCALMGIKTDGLKAAWWLVSDWN